MAALKYHLILAALLLHGCQGASPVRQSTLNPVDIHAAPGQKKERKSGKPSKDIELDHGVLRIVFSPEHRSLRFSKYSLTARNLRDRYIKRDRNDPFAKDPLLERHHPVLAVASSSYRGTDFDRGHLAPAEDLSWNEDAYFASFYMSNMAPQKGGLNRKAWKELEEWARDAACGEEKITVLSGPVLGGRLTRLAGKGPVVPEEFFKLVIDETPPRKVAAFLYKQSDTTAGLLRMRVVNPAEVSLKTGIDFAAEVPGAEELFAKAKANLDGWKTLPEARHCQQRERQVLASELKRKRQAAEPRLPAGRR